MALRDLLQHLVPFLDNLELKQLRLTCRVGNTSAVGCLLKRPLLQLDQISLEKKNISVAVWFNQRQPDGIAYTLKSKGSWWMEDMLRQAKTGPLRC